MSHKLRLAGFLLIFLAWSVLALGQPKPPPSTAPAQVQSPATTEVQVLKAQIETMRSYQDQFISVITWSLGAVLTIAFGLAAYNWYSSKLSYERDIQALRQENKALHAELTALLKSETEQAAKRLLDELASKQAEIQAALTKAFDSKLSDIKDEVLDLEYNFTEDEAENALKEKSYAWAIYKYCRLLEISVRQSSDYYQVGEILDRIGKVLDNPATSLSSDNVIDAVEKLRRLPKRYQTAAENLIQRITKAHK